MPKMAHPAAPIGQHYGKRDMERIGIFAETGWLHGVPYVSPHGYEFRKGGTKGRQLLPGGGKTKVGLQDCYFDKGPFKRIFEKEAYSSAIRENYLASMASSKKNISSAAFLAGAPSKKHSTPGDFYGTFAGRVKAMSRQEKSTPQHGAELPNVKTNPGKKGTYGYADTTFNKFPKHMSEPYQSRYGMAAANQRLILDGPFISTIYPSPCFNGNPWHVVKPGSTYIRRSETKPKYQGVVWVPPQFPKKVRPVQKTLNYAAFLYFTWRNQFYYHKVITNFYPIHYSQAIIMMAALANFLHTSQTNTLTSSKLCEVLWSQMCSIHKFVRRACTLHLWSTKMWTSVSMPKTGAASRQCLTHNWKIFKRGERITLI
ncbi:UPF0602 protein C4orf47 homolog isoform X1 [Frankliniella occidentalis]|uniref:Cilia-and flagella-associated protein 96 n=1 Tax=Frankliniella occidentalis TaxID=133901 RepID=A0A9C6U6K7_FRAOC|nr:UPF0602 protein C4orf47 homolog isoform X1 [Frankliniella occidentalis]